MDSQCYLSSELAIFELHCASISKRGLVQNLSHENEFDLHENEPVGETYFCEWSRFNTEAKGNFEIAYSGLSHLGV